MNAAGDLNSECRGGPHSPDDATCKARDKAYDDLETRNWCWSYSDWRVFPQDYKWHRCDIARPANFKPDAIIEAEKPAIPAPPAHHWIQQEGGFYYYAPSLSRAEREEGVASPRVVKFRLYNLTPTSVTVASPKDDGLGVILMSCSIPCRIIKLQTSSAFGLQTEELLYSPDSLGGQVIQDAINGQLGSMSPPTPAATLHIPPEGLSQATITQ